MASNSPKKPVVTGASLEAIISNLGFSKEKVVAFYKLSGTPYEFMSDDARVSTARRLNNVLESLLTRPDRTVECELFVTSRPYDINAWKKELSLRAERWNAPEGFGQYIDEMEEYLYQHNFQEKEVYIGITLGSRHERTESSLLGGLSESVNLLLSKFIKVEDKEISEEEIKYWTDKSRHYTRALKAEPADALPATPSDIARLLKRTMFPSMYVPPVSINERERWGHGEIAQLAEGYVENNKKFLKITQTAYDGQDMDGYRATLAFSKFPDTLYFPQQEPWIHFASLLGWGVNFYSRFVIVPTDKVRKDVAKKVKEVADEVHNAGVAARGGSLPLDIQEKEETTEYLEYSLNKTKESWVYGWHRVIVEAPTEEILRDYAQNVIDHYRDLDIEIQWPSGDQLNLLLESQPVDKVRVKAYEQRQSIAIIPGGMPTATSAVGDRVEIKDSEQRGWIGPYLGKTTSRIEEPVFLSVHSAISRNNPPGLAISGRPGVGKSFTAFTLTCQMAMQGIWSIYIDPKADALPMANLKGLPKTQAFDLRDGADGLLDPFNIQIGSKSEQVLMALETLRLLLGGSITPAQENAMINALSQVSEAPDPSLYKVVDTLYNNQENEDARNIGNQLKLISELPFASLCFSPQRQVNLRPDEGLTIVTLLGIDLPTPDIDPQDYSYPNRLGVAIMYLLTTFTLGLMQSLNRRHPKAIIIDEAWAITSTVQGRSMIPKIIRMGRSLNTAIVLVSQNAADLDEGGIRNSVSLKMAFNSKDADEITGVINFLRLEDTDYNREMVSTLGVGECLIQDVDGRTSRVQVDSWNEEWRVAFDTNPETAGKHEHIDAV